MILNWAKIRNWKWLRNGPSVSTVITILSCFLKVLKFVSCGTASVREVHLKLSNNLLWTDKVLILNTLFPFLFISFWVLFIFYCVSFLFKKNTLKSIISFFVLIFSPMDDEVIGWEATVGDLLGDGFRSLKRKSIV